MYTRIIRRIATVVAALVATSIAMAHPPLPVFINGPAADATISYSAMFDWSNTGANKYTLKFTILETGEKLKLSIPEASCGVSDCEIPYTQTPLLAAVKDGQTIHWRVIAKYDDGKSKSVPRSFLANTVQAPQALVPASGSVLDHGDSLGWDVNAANITYVLVMKNSATREKAAKLIFAPASCPIWCQVDLYDVADLDPGTQYEWRVKVKGLNGDKAVSPKRTFSTPLAESAR